MEEAGGSERNGGGAGGSSFISGHKGCIAITSATSTTPLINTTSTDIDVKYSYHYSGKIFEDTLMISGTDSMPTYDGTSTMTGNTGNGYAKITFLEPIQKTDAELAFGSLSDFRKIETADCEGYSSTWGTYDDIYTGNNEQLEYNEDGSIYFDEDNPILVREMSETESQQLFQEEYSIYFTVKADVNQGEKYGNTIASIGAGNGQYIAWVSIFQGYLHVYSYMFDNVGQDFAQETTQKGFGSYDITKYSNTVFNVQITCNRTGMTKVYINGEALPSFESGGETMPATDVCIGDLRPLRNLKFQGTIYDFSMYNTELTYTQIINNWNYAKYKWID